MWEEAQSFSRANEIADGGMRSQRLVWGASGPYFNVRKLELHCIRRRSVSTSYAKSSKRQQSCRRMSQYGRSQYIAQCTQILKSTGRYAFSIFERYLVLLRKVLGHRSSHRFQGKPAGDAYQCLLVSSARRLSSLRRSFTGWSRSAGQGLFVDAIGILC